MVHISDKLFIAIILINIKSKKWKQFPCGIHVSIFCHADIITCMPCYNKIPHDMPPKPLPLQTNGRDQFKGQKTL